MSITILYTDLRSMPSKLERRVVDWHVSLTAFDVLEHAFGLALAQRIEDDLHANIKEIMVSWWNKENGDHSEIGGVGRIDWIVPDQMVFIVSYENGATTQKQIDDSIEWTLKQEL